MTENTVTETDENTAVDTEAPEPTESPAEGDLEARNDEPAGDDDTFSREYVEKLRRENGKYRQRAQQADDLAHRLHRALVAADGRLQDPSDLDFDEDHLDGDHLAEAIGDLLQRKPHLAARRISGDIGQGAVSTPAEVNLMSLLGGHQ